MNKKAIWTVVGILVIIIIIGGLANGKAGVSSVLFAYSYIAIFVAIGCFKAEFWNGFVLSALVIIIGFMLSNTLDNEKTDIYRFSVKDTNMSSSFDEAEKALFEIIVLHESLQDCSIYLQHYRYSKRASIVENLLNRKCDSLYEIASKQNTIEGWKEYIKTVPDREIRDSYSRIDEIQEAQHWVTEAKAWARAKEVDSYECYQKYLQLYPNGKHKKQAIDASVNCVFSSEHGSLPKMDRVSYGYGYSSKIKIKNSTGYVLTIQYSGVESKRIVMDPKQVLYVNLKNGIYRITASVSANDVRNYAGSEYLNGGEYSVKYYIVSSPW